MKKALFSWVLTAVCGGLLVTSCGEDKKREQGAQQYRTMVVTKKDMTLERQYSARLTGRQIVEIRPQVSGCITRICINEGENVKKGQVLFVIDQVPFIAALEAAVASRKSAEARLATARMNYENEMQVAARNNLSYTEVKSPVNGVASMIPWHVGSLVNSNIAEPLVTVADDSEMYAYFSINQRQAYDLTNRYGSIAEFISKSPTVGLRLINGEDYDQKGHISAMSGTVDTSTGAISLRATFPNPTNLLHNGGSATVVVPMEHKNCVVIPQEATYELQNRSFVYRVVDGKTKATAVTLFPQNNGKEYIVESGLQVGDTIIAEGAGLLKEGVEVKN